MRQPLVVGNWKMHGSRESVTVLTRAVIEETVACKAEIGVCPTAVHLDLVLQIAGESAVTVGGQNCSEHAQGAYTGEVSASMLADLGCRWVILGHSERRQYFGETSELVAEKLKAARAVGLTPILCCGETLAQRQAGEAEQVVRDQLAPLLEVGLLATDVLAYEPVWAIGTGETASPAQAQDMHAVIRGALAQADEAVAASMRLLYGGSVKADNAAELFAQEDIDGGLVGGASLKAAEFAAIVAAARE